MTALASPAPDGLPQTANEVMRVRDTDINLLRRLLQRFGMTLVMVADTETIPGSYWGETEAGLLGDKLHLRSDTPLQSVLHEAGHYLCMDPDRRAVLNKDAGGDFDEENAVCYLQILLADHIPGFGRDRMLSDMDDWGYTFRLGSARAWFEQEAEQARAWLIDKGLVDSLLEFKWQCR